MKYKEFDLGQIELTSASVAQWDTGQGFTNLQETCSEYSIASLEVQAIAQDVYMRFIGGYDSLAQQLYSPVYSTTAFSGLAASSFSATGESANNVSMRIKRVQNVEAISDAYGLSARISSNTAGTFYFSTIDMQIMIFQLQAKTTGAIARPLGIFKGSIEGVSNIFDVVTTSNGFTDLVDCRSYGFMGFEVENTGSQALTSFQLEFIRHRLGAFAVQTFTVNNFVNDNPQGRIQRVRGLNPSTLAAGSKTVVDFNIEECHSVRFKITPITAQVTIRGVLKG